jgi:hypothetical protein
MREREWLEEFVAFPSGVPSQDTILRVLAAVDPMGLRLAYLRWVKAVLGPNVARGAQVAIDGKTLRRSGGGRGQDKPAHMVSALVSGLNLVIGQRSCDEKSNEIRAIPKLLELLSLREALVSIDAMGCQVAIAEKILGKAGRLPAGTQGEPRAAARAGTGRVRCHRCGEATYHRCCATAEGKQGREFRLRAWPP